MIIEMAKSAVFWRNAFPADDGISDELSPRTIVTGNSIDYNRYCHYELGEYVQNHEEHDNSMESRTVGALALRQTRNVQGGYYFLILSTGKVINRNRATKLPMPNEVIDRLHVLARRPLQAMRMTLTNDAGAVDNLDSDDDEDRFENHCDDIVDNDADVQADPVDTDLQADVQDDDDHYHNNDVVHGENTGVQNNDANPGVYPGGHLGENA
jgi:hypothetical protein